ncbi:MAG TPA: sugar kinase [Thermomicrobiales bacterium]|nr:sugar kinase [Thermomicrobiales bacterium]
MPRAVDGDQRGHDLVTFGETMIRLSASGGKRLEEATTLDLAIGGTEANVAVALARLGLRVAWLSALPDNTLGRRVDAELRRHGVDTTHVIWSDRDRAGVYFLDPGVPPRPTRVLYDRVDSAVSRVDPDAINYAIVERAGALHLTGVTPALSPGCAAVCHRLAGAAARAGIPIVLDVNYRARLWPPDAAAAGLAPLLDRATLLLCGASDAATIWGLAGAPEEVARALLDRSAAESVVVTLAADGALAMTRAGDITLQRAVPVTVVDPVGAGDAFAAGFLSRWLGNRDGMAAALQAGVALAALKLTMPGDLAIITPAELAETMALAGSPPAPDIDR